MWPIFTRMSAIPEIEPLYFSLKNLKISLKKSTISSNINFKNLNTWEPITADILEIITPIIIGIIIIIIMRIMLFCTPLFFKEFVYIWF